MSAGHHKVRSIARGLPISRRRSTAPGEGYRSSNLETLTPPSPRGDFAQKILGGHSLRLRAIALALRGPPLQLGVRDCNEKIAFTTCQMSNVCCAMFNVVVKTPDDLLTKPPNPQWETI